MQPLLNTTNLSFLLIQVKLISQLANVMIS